MDKARRKVIRALATGTSWTAVAAASGFIGGLTGAVGERLFTTVFPDDNDVDADAGALEWLTGTSADLPAIFAGEGNSIGSALGIAGTSNYLTYAASQFSSYVSRALRPVRHHALDNSDDPFIYDRRRTAIFLGGPAANHVTSALLGYLNLTVEQDGKSTDMPVPDRTNRRTRWAQIHGEQGYGVYSGKLELAARYSSSSGRVVERPVYKLLDKLTGEVISPSVEQGFLANEWLTIVRLNDAGVPKIVIGGMHGYSTEAFCKDISSNIERLRQLTGAVPEYQVIVPVRLSNSEDLTGRWHTFGEIDWAGARTHVIST